VSNAPEQVNPWAKDESSYLDYLEHERHMFAWCLVTFGGIALPEAQSAALSFYAYEQSTDAHRGLVFHDEAWHWAMGRIIGERYWVARPDLERPSSAYRTESEAIFPSLAT